MGRRTSDDRLMVEAELTAYYDDEAEDRARRPLDSRRLEACRRFMAEIDDAQLPLLEVGTGAGRDVKEFVAQGFAIVGVDLSFEQARHARATGAQQVVASARHLPFPDEHFSAMWSMSTLMHVPNTAIRNTLGEMRRVLASDALAAIGAWGGPNVEDYGGHGTGSPRRLFSRRSDETWRSLLELIGEIYVYETWSEDADDFWYQWALLRVS